LAAATAVVDITVKEELPLEELFPVFCFFFSFLLSSVSTVFRLVDLAPLVLAFAWEEVASDEVAPPEGAVPSRSGV